MERWQHRCWLHAAHYAFQGTSGERFQFEWNGKKLLKNVFDASRRISDKLDAKIKQVNKLDSEFNALYSSYSRLDRDYNNLLGQFNVQNNLLQDIKGNLKQMDSYLCGGRVNK